MTKEQYTKLNKFETQLNQSLRNFVRMTMGEFEAVSHIYEDMYHKAVTNQEKSCNSCRLRILKQLAVEYNKYKEKIEENKNGKKR